MTWLRTAAWVGLVVAAAGISYASGTWWVAAIAVGAILLNGLVATVEDDLPGGFNNPDGTHTPRYALVALWSFRVVGVLFLVSCMAAIGLYLFG